jgi:uncharacterized coiled-coil protein SlyX
MASNDWTLRNWWRVQKKTRQPPLLPLHIHKGPSESENPMSQFQDDCIARLNEQVKQDQIIIKKLSDQRDELVAALTDLGSAAFSISNHNHAGMKPLCCLWADLHQCAEHARAVLEKARTA